MIPSCNISQQLDFQSRMNTPSREKLTTGSTTRGNQYVQQSNQVPQSMGYATQFDNMFPATIEQRNTDFLRPQISNPSKAIESKYDNYIMDRSVFLAQNQNPLYSTTSNTYQPLYSENFQNQFNPSQQVSNNNSSQQKPPNGYPMRPNIPNVDIDRMGQSTRNIYQDSRKPVQSSFQSEYFTANFDEDRTKTANPFLIRNPTNSRRDDMEKQRNSDTDQFRNTQGGLLNNFVNFQTQNTRKERCQINSNTYVPMPRTMAIPRENI